MKTIPGASSEQQHLYQVVAEQIISLVGSGTFRPGDKIPSIRELSRQQQVSVNTVKVAYGYLEDRNIIEARPQSGYYVSARLPHPPGEPDISDHPVDPLEISSSQLVLKIMRDVQDKGKVQFGAAIPDPKLVPTVKLNRLLTATCRRYPVESTAYSMPPGNKRLRKQVAKRMLKAGCVLHPDQIIVTNGASEAVYLALRATCKPGDTVAIGTPIYFNFVQMLEQLGLRVIEIPVSPSKGLHLNLLKRAFSENSVQACVAISNFDNPLGSCLNDTKKETLVQLCSRFKVPLIEDDINGDLSFSNDRPSVGKAWDREGNVLLCSSFSKTIAPGYRVGWIAPGKFFERVMQQKIVTNIASATPPQLALAEFLENGGYEHHLRHIRRKYAEKISLMGEAVGRYFPGGTKVTRPEGGFSLWVELPEPVNTLELYIFAEKKGITIAPGLLFSTMGKYTHCLRLNGACWSEENRPAVTTLGRLACDLAAG